MKRFLSFLVLCSFCSSVLSTVPAAVTLTTGQVESIISQQSGTPAPPPPPPPPPGSNIICSGFASTTVITFPWVGPTPQVVPMGLNDAIVIKFTTGNVSSTNNLPSIVGVEYDSAPSQRTAVLSQSPCVFTPISGQPIGHYIVGNTVTAIFAIAPGSGYGYYPVLQKNTTYYLNVKNNLGSACVVGASCQMRFQLSNPGL